MDGGRTSAIVLSKAEAVEIITLLAAQLGDTCAPNNPTNIAPSILLEEESSEGLSRGIRKCFLTIKPTE